MAKFSTSLNQLKEFAKIAKEPIDAQSLNKSIASMVSSLAVLQELASTANSGNISKLKKEYNALFEIVQKIQQFQKNGGSTKDAKLTGSATSMSKSIDKLEDRMMAYYGKSKKEAESYLVKQRQLVEEMKKEGVSAEEKYEISRKINRLNTASLETVKNIQASENKHTATREKDYQNQLKSLSASKQKNVIDEKATNSKLKQLQIDMAIGKRSIEESLSRKKVLSTISAEEAERRKINEALKADVLLRDRISKLNKKEYGTPSKTPSKTNYIEQEERERKKITDALKRDILRRDEQERAIQARKIDYIKQEELAREKITNALKEDILLRDRIAKLDKKEAVIQEEVTVSKLRQLEIDKEKVKGLTVARQKIVPNKSVSINATPESNKNLVDEMKIKEKNIKLNNQLLAFETKMQGFAGGKIKSVQKELANIRMLEKEHKDIGNRLLTEKLTTEQINKLSLQRVDIEGKIANQQRVASNLANKGTLLSNTMSNLSIGKLASRASFVATAKLSYTAMQFVSDAMRNIVTLNVKLQDEMSKTFAIMVDKSNEAKSKMKSGVMNVMAKYNMTLEESTEGLYNVISAQIKESEALNVLNISASTAKANFSDLGNTTKLIAGILNAYSMEADQASRVSDVLSESVRLGTVTLDEYANSLGTIVPSANAAGVSYEELTAVITTMTKKGIHADKAITSLRQVFQMLTTPTKKQSELLADYGIDLNVIDLRANGLIKTMEQLGGVLLEDQFGVASSRRGREALLSFLGDINANYANLDQIMDANGATQRMLAERTSTLSSNFDTFKKTLSNFIATRSGVEGFFGSLNSLIGSYNEAINLAKIQTEDMIMSDVISLKFSKDFISVRKLTNEINKLTESTDALVDPTSEAGKKLKILNDIYFDAGMNVDLLNTSQLNLNKTLEESIDVYQRMATRKLAIDKKAEVQTSIWEIEAKRTVRKRELTDDDIKFYNKNKDKNNGVDDIIKKHLPSLTIGQLGEENFEDLMSYYGIMSNSSVNEMFKEIESKTGIKPNKDILRLARGAKKEKDTFYGESIFTQDTQLNALNKQKTEQVNNLIIWDEVQKKAENDTIKTMDEKSEDEKKRLKELEEVKSKLDASISKFRETAFDFGESSDKVQTRANVQQKITEAKKLKGEIKALSELDPTYDTQGTMLSWANAQINKLEVEFNSIIRDFSDFPITADAEISRILSETVDSINDSMSDEQMKGLADETIGKLSTYLESIGEAPVNSEVTKWLDDLMESIRSAFKSYKPDKIDISLDDLDIPIQIDVANIIKNGLSKVTNSMTQAEYMDIVDSMVEEIANSIMSENGTVNRVLIEKIRTMLEGQVASTAKGYSLKTTTTAKKPKSLSNTFLDSMGWDSESANFDSATATDEEKLAQTEKFNQMVADTTINSMSQMYDVLNQMQLQHIENQLQNKLDAIDAEEEARINAVNSEILTEEHRGREINAINNKYNKKREKAEEKATKEQAKINKRMAIIDATMSFANASMGIWSFWSDKQPVMIPIMQALLAGVYGANLALINGTKYRDGGMLEGASHENGGIPLLGRSGNYYGEAEGGEIIFSKRASDKNTDLLLSMNKHLSSGGDLSTFLTSYLNGRSSGGNAKVGSMYRDGGMTRRFSQNGATIDSSIFDNFAFIDMKGIDETKLYQMWKIGKIKDRSL